MLNRIAAVQRGEDVGTSKTSRSALGEDISSAFALTRLAEPIFLILVHGRQFSLQRLVQSLSEGTLLAGADPSGSSNVDLW